MVAGILLLVFGALVAIGNWSLLLRWVLQHKTSSLVPLIGTGALLAGARLIGWRWGMLVALADPASCRS